MLQNLGLAMIYNAVAMPIAIAGLVTPLIAAVAMSGSSLLVTLNALRAQLPTRAEAARRGAIASVDGEREKGGTFSSTCCPWRWHGLTG
jgi:hypothetical protein